MYKTKQLADLMGGDKIEFNKGDKLRIGAVHNSGGSGLDYHAQHITALESGCSGGWDVYDGIGADGAEVSFYGYSIIEKIREEETLPAAEKLAQFTQPICPNCGQWQHSRFNRGAFHYDCFNDCNERGFTK